MEEPWWQQNDKIGDWLVDNVRQTRGARHIHGDELDRHSAVIVMEAKANPRWMACSMHVKVRS
ncbi:MAG TPA: hypothetical protein DCE44_20565 [Verrucomicrobiales bacterium]|nr:hypothetical protein [Verrucomicrobiales bacterium]